jgi:hypothetical protein
MRYDTSSVHIAFHDEWFHGNCVKFNVVQLLRSLFTMDCYFGHLSEQSISRAFIRFIFESN